MPYSINTYSLGRTYTVEDGTIDSSLDIKLIGKNYAGYGEVQNENFVYLLENFAGANAPPRPISGQLWYDTANKKLKFYDSTTANWKVAGGATVYSTEPAGLGIGDFWYNSTTQQVYVYNGTEYVLVGPQGIAGLGTTQMKSIQVTDNTVGANHALIAAYVDGEVIYVISNSEEFTLSTASQTELGGSSKFGVIKPGITLANTNNGDGVTDVGSGKIFWGTVSNSMLLDDHPIDDFVLKTGGEIAFDSIVRFADIGYTVGDQNDLIVKIDSDGSTPLFKSTNDVIKFQTTSTGPVINTPLKFVGADVLPGSNGVTDLGSPVLAFGGVYATNFYGTSDQADALKVSTGVYRTGAVAATGNTVAVRDSGGNLTATSFLGNATSATTADSATQADSLQVGSQYFSATVDTANNGTPNTIVARDLDGNVNAVYFQGTATSALFADLAEKYLADKEYETGTVVIVGGDAEVTACQLGDRAFGAVSASPAFKMNEGLVGGTYIALKGRVPVKVIGKVKKGDRLVAAGEGYAGVIDVVLRNIPIKASTFPDTFAIALESSDDENVKLVEAIIL
jgi:hypothetical protein